MDDIQTQEDAPVEEVIEALMPKGTPGFEHGTVIVNSDGEQERIVVTEDGWHKEPING